MKKRVKCIVEHNTKYRLVYEALRHEMIYIPCYAYFKTINQVISQGGKSRLLRGD